MKTKKLYMYLHYVNLFFITYLLCGNGDELAREKFVKKISAQMDLCNQYSNGLIESDWQALEIATQKKPKDAALYVSNMCRKNIYKDERCCDAMMRLAKLLAQSTPQDKKEFFDNFL